MAKEQGCKEFASDCEFDNCDDFEFNIAMDFDEANRIFVLKNSFKQLNKY